VITTSVIAAHHIIFWILQINEFPVYAFEVEHVTFGFLLIHAFFAVAEGGVLTYIAKRNFAASLSALTLTNVVSEILKDPNNLNLSVKLDHDNPRMADFNRFVTSIKDLIEQTSKVGLTVNRVSGQVAELTTGLQKSLSETSLQVDSIASSSEEMSSTIAHVAANASSVNDIATQTKTLSSSAKDTIEGTSKDVSQLRTDLTETSNTINSLSEKCDRISQVMEAIKVVSEQTNLLALNAAIESARAGEHGRGFAVVADEVRQLAIKTRESVEEISEVSQALINDGNTSVGQMSQCLKSAEKAMEATSEACNMIDEVLAGITQVEASIGSVASSTEQQSMASSSIAASAQQLYDLSQQETASATQTLTEVEELRKHSETLEKQLSKFHV
jgi:methyl-accepting chemotaxis protein